MKTKYTTIAWMTDLHLHQANPANRTKFLKELVAAEFDAAIITGDISTSSQVIEDLASLSDACGNRNLFFVLGNHDFFDASFSSVDVAVEKLCKTRDNLHYLEHGGTYRLAENLGLVGCRGWSDGRAGLGSDSRIYSSDAFRIRDLMGSSRKQLFGKMRELGRQSANRLRKSLPPALASHRHVIFATHFPPFYQAVRFGKKGCDYLRQPFFCNLTAGHELMEINRHYPHCQTTVLCGHTHCETKQRMGKNIEIMVGAAKPGNPEFKILQFPQT